MDAALQHGCFQSVVPRPAPSASPENSLEMEVWGHPEPAAAVTAVHTLAGPPGASGALPRLQTAVLRIIALQQTFFISLFLSFHF